MITKEHLLELMRREFGTTLKVMRAYPAEQGHFKPHERSNSALQLFRTFVIEMYIIKRSLGDLMTSEQMMKYAPESLEQGIVDFERTSTEVVRMIEAKSEDELAADYDFYGMHMPAITLAEMMLFDQIHHRGQLSVYIRMAGGKVPAIYGPSADEPRMTINA